MVRPPPTEKYQNARGTMLCFRRSEAIHCTTNRAENRACPSRPIPSQRWSVVTRSGGPAEDRLQHPVRAADVFRPPPARDEREDLLRVLARHGRRLVGPHVRELAQRDLERDRHPIEAVDRDRLLAALDLADELAGEAGAITQPLLAEGALLAERPQPLPQELPHVFRRA